MHIRLIDEQWNNQVVHVFVCPTREEVTSKVEGYEPPDFTKWDGFVHTPNDDYHVIVINEEHAIGHECLHLAVAIMKAVHITNLREEATEEVLAYTFQKWEHRVKDQWQAYSSTANP